MGIDAGIPVIDLFAGPGGLGEGFASVRGRSGSAVYKTCLSIECDEFAHRTLLARSFYRQFAADELPPDYYAYVRAKEGESSRLEWLLGRHPKEAQRAVNEAWRARLGEVSSQEVDDRIRAALGSRGRDGRWILIGGPPCQAYSVVGRARMRPVRGVAFDDDARHTLYKQYLRILRTHAPAVFVMENVPGILSSRHRGQLIFERIVRDLASPGGGLKYSIHAISPSGRQQGSLSGAVVADAKDFVVRCDQYGIPQARRRVIVVGVRDGCIDCSVEGGSFLHPAAQPVPLDAVLDGLPRIRSGVSRQRDSADDWLQCVRAADDRSILREVKAAAGQDVADKIRSVCRQFAKPKAGMGGRFVRANGRQNGRNRRKASCIDAWIHDPKLQGFCNHQGRRHIAGDLHRYLFCAAFAAKKGYSPTLAEFPEALLPAHANVRRAVAAGHFSDRFRVQLRGQPATTITAHISKDGHAYIHPDPSQCRSLTVREAARIQTFPDNYFFEGPRTSQYAQVGNAVPPLLAFQLASALVKLFQ